MPDRQRPRSEQRQRQVMLALRVNPEEERCIREAAKAQRVSVASLIRKAVLAAAEQPAETEWGIRWLLHGTPCEYPAIDEGDARRVLAGMRDKHPEYGAQLIVRDAERPAGPWRLADDPATRETEQGDG
jgi:hypothetical protein